MTESICYVYKVTQNISDGNLTLSVLQQFNVSNCVGFVDGYFINQTFFLAITQVTSYFLYVCSFLFALQFVPLVSDISVSHFLQSNEIAAYFVLFKETKTKNKNAKQKRHIAPNTAYSDD